MLLQNKGTFAQVEGCPRYGRELGVSPVHAQGNMGQQARCVPGIVLVTNDTRPRYCFNG
jgi:hypothetical protein